MASRLEKYSDEIDSSSTLSTRTGRNSRLYKEIYGKYDNSDNLPLEDNTDEIDMESLKELVLNSNRKKEIIDYSSKFNSISERPRKIDEKKVYDINKILEKAKYENNKLKEPITYTSKINKNILSTLENDDISLDKIKKDTNEYEKKVFTKEDLSMTRELKFKSLAKENDDLSLEMFSDLKPTGDTITTKPITDTSSFIKPLPNTDSITKEDFLSSDTSDIDVIREPSNNKIDNDFFTSSYEFSKKDFTPDDDDFLEEEKSSGLVKIILLFLFIAVLIGVIIYFILNYGIGV